MATHLHLPVIPVNPQAKHAQPIVDYAVEANVLEHVRANRWLALDIGSFRVARFNWVVFSCASAILWAFVIGVMASEKKDADGAKFNAALSQFAMWQKWITQNFTWLYIGTQVCFVSLLLYALANIVHCTVHCLTPAPPHHYLTLSPSSGRVGNLRRLPGVFPFRSPEAWQGQ